MLTGLATVLLVLVAFLAIPLSLDFRVCWPTRAADRVRVEWAFGLVRFTIRPSGRERRSSQRETTKKASAPSKRSPPGKSKVLAAIADGAFRQRVVRFGRDAWRAIGKRDVRLVVRVGLGDPADTGQLWAVMGPMSAMLAAMSDAAVSITPDFLDSTLEADGSGRVRLIPLQFVYLAAALLICPPFWRGIKRMWVA